METSHATAKAVRPADISKPPTHSKALSPKNPTRCTHLPTASQRVSTWYSARNATNSMSARQRMPSTSISMATDLISETWKHRNLKWLSTSIDVDTPWKTLRSWSLKNFGIMTFNSEEGGNDSGLTNSSVWHLRGWISPDVHEPVYITSLPACFNHFGPYEDPVGFELLYMKWWIYQV